MLRAVCCSVKEIRKADGEGSDEMGDDAAMGVGLRPGSAAPKHHRSVSAYPGTADDDLHR